MKALIGSDEHFVRSHWGYACLIKKNNGGIVLMRREPSQIKSFADYNQKPTVNEGWAAAKVFTEEWLHNIEQLKEEISEIKKYIQAFGYNGHGPIESEALIYQRILFRLQNILANLKKEMK